MRILLLLFLMIAAHCLSFAQSTAPKLVLDHIFFWTEKDAPEVKLFQEEGFAVAPRGMVHTGFGTGGRYINFYNVYLEFLYLDEKATIDPKVIYFPYGRKDKMREKGKSPFGIGLAMTPYDTTRIPFEAEAVWASWMRPNTNLYIAASGRSYEQEPIIFIVPPTMERPKINTLNDLGKMVSDSARRERLRQTLRHTNGVQKLTHAKITSNTKQFSSTVKSLGGIENLEIVKGKEHLLELTFDEHRQKKMVDFRPKLPVMIKY